jgi:NAD(P)-dependent dehydrogenase (short-subunit alcohol dehydrogenase family)
VAARDLGRYGITVNAISPVAGTRMTVTDAYLKARELRKQQGIQREGPRATGEIEQLDPDDVAPMVAYLASEQARDVNGQMFLCYGRAVAIVSHPRPERTLFKPDGYWTLDELDALAPSALTRRARQSGAARRRADGHGQATRRQESRRDRRRPRHRPRHRRAAGRRRRGGGRERSRASRWMAAGPRARRRRGGRAIKARGGTAVANYDSVSDFAAAERIIETAVRELGGIDVLVNNAGILRDRMVFNMSEEEWDARHRACI